MDAPSVRRVGLLLLPGFSMLALGGVLDALAAANGLQDEARYRPECLSLAGGELACGAGARIATRGAAAAEGGWYAVFVMASEPAAPEADALQWLCNCAAGGAAVGGIGAGAAWLAAAGLLDGQRACADWPWLDGLAEDHPGIAWANGLWEINADSNRLSCAGGAASLDLCCAWLAQRHGERLGQELLQALGLRALRPRDERQRAGYSERRGAGSPKLAEALALMEANLAEPLPTDEVARLAGVSRRQLERLFKQHLDTLPSRHYLALRLGRAQRLLQQSSQSILQIGLSCGFSSGPHFSNAYKAHFGHTPRDERSQRAQAWRGAPPSQGDSP